MLTERIEADEPRFLRLLARIRFHQGDVDGAVALEESYLDAKEFNELSSSYRLGRVLEEVGRTAEAVEEFEKASKKSTPIRRHSSSTRRWLASRSQSHFPGSG